MSIVLGIDFIGGRVGCILCFRRCGFLNLVFFIAGLIRGLDFLGLMLVITGFFSFGPFGDAALLVLPGGVLLGLAEIVPAAVANIRTALVSRMTVFHDNSS